MSKFIVGYPEGRQTPSRNRRSIPPGGYSSIFGPASDDVVTERIRTPVVPRHRTAVDNSRQWTPEKNHASHHHTMHAVRTPPSQHRRRTTDVGAAPRSGAGPTTPLYSSPSHRRTPAQERRDLQLGDGTPPSWWGSGSSPMVAQVQRLTTAQPLDDFGQRVSIGDSHIYDSPDPISRRPPSSRGRRKSDMDDRLSQGVRTSVSDSKSVEVEQLQLLVEHLSTDVANLKSKLEQSEALRKQDRQLHEQQHDIAITAAAEARAAADVEKVALQKLERELQAYKERNETLEHDLEEAQLAEKKATAKYKKLKEMTKDQLSKRPETSSSSTGKRRPSQPKTSSKNKFAFGSTVKTSKEEQASTETRSAASRSSSRASRSRGTERSRSDLKSSRGSSSKPKTYEYENKSYQSSYDVYDTNHDANPEAHDGYMNNVDPDTFTRDGRESTDKINSYDPYDNGDTNDNNEVYSRYDSATSYRRHHVHDTSGIDKLHQESNDGPYMNSGGDKNEHDDYDADTYADFLLQEARRSDLIEEPNHDTNLDEVPVGSGQSLDASTMDEPSANVQRTPCPNCGRKFDVNRISKHMKICSTVGTKKRKPLDGTKMRVAGTESEQFLKKGRKKDNLKAKPNGNWRAKSEALRAALKAARNPNSAPAPAFEDPSLVPCDSCGRTFSETAAARHIPLCRAKQGIRNPSKHTKSKGRSGR